MPDMWGPLQLSHAALGSRALSFPQEPNAVFAKGPPLHKVLLGCISRSTWYMCGSQPTLELLSFRWRCLWPRALGVMALPEPPSTKEQLFHVGVSLCWHGALLLGLLGQRLLGMSELGSCVSLVPTTRRHPPPGFIQVSPFAFRDSSVAKTEVGCYSKKPLGNKGGWLISLGTRRAGAWCILGASVLSAKRQ